MTELFSDESVRKDSPRIVWLKTHNLALGELPCGTRFCASDQYITHADTHSAAVFVSNFTKWFDIRATTRGVGRCIRSTALNNGPGGTAYRPPWDDSISGDLSLS